MSANRKKSENFTQNEKGQSRFAKGNKIGRMKKKGYTINDLTDVVMEYEKTHDNTILKHYIEQLFTSDKLLDKFVDRYIPPVLKQEVDIEGELKVTAEIEGKLSKLTVQELRKLANNNTGN